MHVDVMSSFMDILDLQDVTMFAQDWGGLIGLRVVERSFCANNDVQYVPARNGRRKRLAGLPTHEDFRLERRRCRGVEF